MRNTMAISAGLVALALPSFSAPVPQGFVVPGLSPSDGPNGGFVEFSDVISNKASFLRPPSITTRQDLDPQGYVIRREDATTGVDGLSPEILNLSNFGPTVSAATGAGKRRKRQPHISLGQFVNTGSFFRPPNSRRAVDNSGRENTNTFVSESDDQDLDPFSSVDITTNGADVISSNARRSKISLTDFLQGKTSKSRSFDERGGDSLKARSPADPFLNGVNPAGSPESFDLSQFVSGGSFFRPTPVTNQRRGISLSDFLQGKNYEVKSLNQRDGESPSSGSVFNGLSGPPNGAGFSLEDFLNDGSLFRVKSGRREINQERDISLSDFLQGTTYQRRSSDSKKPRGIIPLNSNTMGRLRFGGQSGISEGYGKRSMDFEESANLNRRSPGNSPFSGPLTTDEMKKIIFGGNPFPSQHSRDISLSDFLEGTNVRRDSQSSHNGGFSLQDYMEHGHPGSIAGPSEPGRRSMDEMD